MYATEFGKLLQKLNKDFKLQMEQQLTPTLTEGQLYVLELLNVKQPMKPSDLIEHLATTPAAISTLLDRMEKNNLIQRVRDQQDRRIVWVHLTEIGRSEFERGIQIRELLLENYLNRISTYNQQYLVYLLGKVAN
jgi:DNA-binding MarR family transcriptional regulator